MTRITYLHGVHRIPQDEWVQRGQLVKPLKYVPFNSMTQGQTAIHLLRQRYVLYNQFDPHPLNQKAVEMLTQAAVVGVHGIRFTGAIPNELQPLARLISNFSRRTAPTSAYNPRVSGIGANCIDIALKAFKKKFPLEPEQITVENSKGIPVKITNPKLQPFLFGCQKIGIDLEKIFNENIPKCGHHVPYGMIHKNFNLPAKAYGRRDDHIKGIEGTARLNDFPLDLMYLWYDNAIIEKNATSVGVGTAGGWESSFALATKYGTSNKRILEYAKWVGINGKASPYISGIGLVWTAPLVIKLVIAITGAIAAASTLVSSIKNNPNATALQFSGFGTGGFSANENDWDADGILNNNDPDPNDPCNPNPNSPACVKLNAEKEEEDRKKKMLLLAAGAGILLLTSK